MPLDLLLLAVGSLVWSGLVWWIATVKGRVHPPTMALAAFQWPQARPQKVLGLRWTIAFGFIVLWMGT